MFHSESIQYSYTDSLYGMVACILTASDFVLQCSSFFFQLLQLGIKKSQLFSDVLCRQTIFCIYLQKHRITKFLGCSIKEKKMSLMINLNLENSTNYSERKHNYCGGRPMIPTDFSRRSNGMPWLTVWGGM